MFEGERGQANALVNSLSRADRISLPRALDADYPILRIDRRDDTWARGVEVAGTASRSRGRGAFFNQRGGPLSPELPQSSLTAEQVESGVVPDAYRAAHAELFCVLQRTSLNQLASCR